MQIPFFRPSLDGNERKYIEEVLQSGWLTTASKTSRFEGEFREMVGAQHALAVNSCTSALHLALDAIGLQAGDKVLVPSLTFTATAEVIRYIGADPVFLDVPADTGLLEPEQVRRALTESDGVKACIVVHFGGQSAELRTGDGGGIADICEAAGVRIIIDAAHAFPASDEYGPVGSTGDITCFSFYANKTITTGEGGMAVTNDPELAARMRLMRLHGIDRDVWGRFTDKQASWEYDVTAPGYKYNLPDLNAAVGLGQLERAEQFRAARQRCALRYHEALEGFSPVSRPRQRVKPEWHAWHLYPIVVNPGGPCDRGGLIERLTEDGIGTSVHYKPLHRMTYYRDRYQLEARHFPGTERYWQGCLSLPIYPSLGDDEIDYVVSRLQHHLG